MNMTAVNQVMVERSKACTKVTDRAARRLLLPFATRKRTLTCCGGCISLAACIRAVPCLAAAAAVDRQPSPAVVHAAGADALLVARQQGYEIGVGHQHRLAASEIADGNQVAPLCGCGGHAALPSGKVCSMAVCGALCSARRRHSVCQRASKVTKVRWRTCTGAPKIHSAES